MATTTATGRPKIQITKDSTGLYARVDVDLPDGTHAVTTMPLGVTRTSPAVQNLIRRLLHKPKPVEEGELQ